MCSFYSCERKKSECQLKKSSAPAAVDVMEEKLFATDDEDNDDDGGVEVY